MKKLSFNYEMAAPHRTLDEIMGSAAYGALLNKYNLSYIQYKILNWI